MVVDFERFIAEQAGDEWVIGMSNTEAGMYIAFRPDLVTDGFAGNLVLQALPPGGPAEGSATIPAGQVVLAQRGIEPPDAVSAELLLLDVTEGVSVTQWIGYRFGSTHPARLVISAATADWPALADIVAKLSQQDEWSAS